ncbi:MAG TPA: serine hydrolase [Candidatus Dormibacteraeota bacterium]|jgi:CubicO group peptidase (beta-lactamase class C family)|nr:serine hydrolase [Candidatus Dormibacteraeota bacterium]
MSRALLSLATLLAVCIPSPSPGAPAIKRLDSSTISPAEIDQTVSRLMNAAEVTGAGIAILNNGRVTYLKAYGFRDKEHGLALTVDSVMSAASFSKVAFAYMVMQLVDEGVLDLDKPVYQYLPKPLREYPDYADLAKDPRYKQITARMLLSHTSGFPNWRAFEDDRKLKIHFTPGSRFAYSGEGINLLQVVVEAITKKPLEELMQQHVFGPLGMTRTSMVWQARFESDYANGYDEYGRLLGPQKRTHADAAGSMQTTVSDFARFMEAVLDGKLLQNKTRKLMLSSQIEITSKREFPTLSDETTDANKAIHLSYGLGWGLFWTPYGEAFFKEGHDEGWRNYTVGFDGPKCGIVIMTNSGNGEGIFVPLLETLLKDTFTPEWESYTPYDKLPPRPPLKQHKQVAVDAVIQQRYVGRYQIPPEAAPNVVLTVRWEGGRLTVQENDEPKQDLLPESPTQFYTIADDVYTFDMDAQGHITQIVLHIPGHDIPAKPIP